jgi:cytochrome c oxidase accessory protein FixG
MYDHETLAVHYDTKRGEALHGRASARSGMRSLEERHAKGNGDCIDCGLCVQVCPTGIDIRDGLQYKCISCGLCIDACNGIMDSMGFPRGLIRYDSESNLLAAVQRKPRLHWKRLKVIGYGLAIVLMSGYLVYSIVSRSSYENAVTQIRQPLFVQLSNGDIRNRYQIRITNKRAIAERFSIRATGIPASALELGNFREVEVKPGHSVTVLASVTLPPEQALVTSQVTFIISPLSRPSEAHRDSAGFYYKLAAN